MGIPAPSNSGSGDGVPFLKPKDIAKKGSTAVTLLGRPVSIQTGQYGTQILVPCKVGKKEFTFPVKIDSGNHNRLFSEFGSNEKKWKGKILVAVAKFKGKDYVQVQ